MKPETLLSIVAMLIGALIISSCADASSGDGDLADREIRVVTTTTMLRDALENVGGDRVTAESLMGPGVDPHSYRASEGDVMTMAEADIVFYNGLHLEGAMSDVLGQMDSRTTTVAVAERIPENDLLAPSADLADTFASGFDPHIWFDVQLWMQAVEIIRDAMIELDPDHESVYSENAESHLAELEDLDEYARSEIQRIPELQRVMITAHDAFQYLGNAYGIEVRGLQSLSTAVEAGAGDVRELTDFIVEREIPAMFLESAVPPQGIMAVKEAVESRGHSIEIGGELYGDALGDPAEQEGTYIGAFRHNIDTLVSALAVE